MGYGSMVPDRTDHDAFGYWLAGFLDGEGCFDIARQRRATGMSYFYCRLSVTLRADDAPLLWECQQRLSGHVYVGHRPGPIGHPKARWEVSRRDELRRIVALLRVCPMRSKKRRDFETFAVALEAPNGRDPVLEVLQRQLREGRAFA